MFDNLPNSLYTTPIPAQVAGFCFMAEGEVNSALRDALLAMGLGDGEIGSIVALRNQARDGDFHEEPGQTLDVEALAASKLVRDRIYTVDEKIAIQVSSTLMDYKVEGATGLYPGAEKISLQFTSENVYAYPQASYISPPYKDRNGNLVVKAQTIGINRFGIANRSLVNVHVAERAYDESNPTNLGPEIPKMVMMAFVGPGSKFEGIAADLEYAHVIPLISEDNTTQGQHVAKALRTLQEAIMVYTTDGRSHDNTRVVK